MSNPFLISTELEQIWKIAEQFFHHSDCDPEIIDHSHRVRCICQEISDSLDDTSLALTLKRKDLIYKAAYLHDISKAELPKKNSKRKDHNQASAKVIDKCFDCSGSKENAQYAKELKEIVIAHRGAFSPSKNIALEAAVLRMADKIDKFNKIRRRATKGLWNKKKFKKKTDKETQRYEKNLNKIKESDLIPFFEEFQVACDAAKEKILNGEGWCAS